MNTAVTPLGSAGLERVLRRSVSVNAILRGAPALGLPQWHLGAGGIAQTIWNHLHGFDLAHGIKDLDLVYFDASDMSHDAEIAASRQANDAFACLSIELDVKNQARVHQWYGAHFGIDIAPYASVEDVIATWPTTASSVGVRYDGDTFVVCAPFGLDDMFDMIVRPNKRIVTREVYERKAQRWAAHWPKLTVVPW